MAINLPEVTAVHSIASLTFQLGINVTIGRILVQMHFGLTGYQFSTIGGSNKLHVYPAQHNSFDLPDGKKDFLIHRASKNYVTFEVDFRSSYILKLLNINVLMISEFNKRIESGDATLFGRDS